MRNRRLEKEILSEAGQRIRQSGELRAERKRLRKAYRRQTPAGVATLGWLAFLSLYAVIGRDTAISFGMANFWALGAYLMAAARLWNKMEADRDLAFMLHVPLEDRRVFELQWRKAARQSIWVAAQQGAIVAPAMFKALGMSPYLWLAPVVLLGHWLLVVSGAAWMGRRFQYAFPLAGAMFLLALGLPWIPRGWADQLIFLSWFSPPAWLNAPLYFGAVLGRAELIWAFIPAMLLAAILWREKAVWRDSYRASAEAGGITSPLQDVVNEQAQRSVSVSAQEELIKHWGEALAHKSALVGGWLEKWATSWLTRRQAVVMELLTGGAPGWTRRLTIAGFIGGGAALFALAAPRFMAPLLPFALLLSGAFALPLLGGDWSGLRPVSREDTSAAPHYPVGYQEVVASMHKVNTLRFLSFLPLALGLAAILGAIENQLLAGILFVLRVYVALWMAQPMAIFLQLAQMTDDTTRSKLFGCALIGLICLAALLGAGFVFAEGWLMAVCFGVPFALLPWILCWWYGRRWDAGKFDLMPPPGARSSW